MQKKYIQYISKASKPEPKDENILAPKLWKKIELYQLAKYFNKHLKAPSTTNSLQI